MVDGRNCSFPLSSCNQISPWELMKFRIKLSGFPILASVFGTELSAYNEKGLRDGGGGSSSSSSGGGGCGSSSNGGGGYNNNSRTDQCV